MAKCDICEGKAIWQRIRDKNGEHKYLCDPCLMELPDPVSTIDSYKYIGDKNESKGKDK